MPATGSEPRSDVVKLRRNLSARIFGGTRLHAVLVVLFVLDLVATVLVALTATGSGLLALPISVAVLFMLSAFGFSAVLSVEDTGIAWRYAVQRAFLWKDVQQVHFTSASRSFVGTGTRPVIVLTLDGITYGVTPAYGVSTDRLRPFARRLAAFAAAGGAEIVADDERWGELGALPAHRTSREDTR